MTATQKRIEDLHPNIRLDVSHLVEEANNQLNGRSQMIITQGFRSFAEQDALFRQRPKVTQARGGQSFHNYGLAIDFCLVVDGNTSWDMKGDYDGDLISDWSEVVRIFEEAGFEWGGHWKFVDNCHFQRVYGYSWQQLLEKHNNKEFIKGTTYVVI